MWKVPFDSLLQIFVASMLPIGELRLGIPLVGDSMDWRSFKFILEYKSRKGIYEN